MASDLRFAVDMEKYLNKLGEEGWRLLPNEVPYKNCCYIMEREKENLPDASIGKIMEKIPT